MRLSYRFSAVLLAGALSLSLAAGASAQKGQRVKGAGQAAVVAPALVNKLNLTADQQAKIKAAGETLKAERQKAQGLATPQEKRQAMRTATLNYQATVKSVLTDEQEKQLAQMVQASREYRGLGRIGQNLAGLNLSEEQKGKIKAIVAKYQPQIQKLRAEQKSATDKQALRGQVQDLNQKMAQEIKAVLTPEQVQQMTPQRRARKNASR